MWIRSLVGELRSHKLHGMAKKKKGKIIYLPFLLLAQLKSSICLSWGQETEKETFSEEIRLGFLEEEP